MPFNCRGARRDQAGRCVSRHTEREEPATRADAAGPSCPPGLIAGSHCRGRSAGVPRAPSWWTSGRYKKPRAVSSAHTRENRPSPRVDARQPVGESVPPHSTTAGAHVFDTAITDELLATTRAVRKRLDLDRPVDPQVILECIALAQQAPTGTNAQSWRWVVVTEPATKAALAEIYRGGCLAVPAAGCGARRRTRRPAGCTRARCSSPRRSSRSRCSSSRASNGASTARRWSSRRRRSGRSSRRRGASSSRCGRAGSARCGRPRTSGTNGPRRPLLGIPDTVTQVAMFPVAHTIGTDFKRADATAARVGHVLGDRGEPPGEGAGSPAAPPALVRRVRAGALGRAPHRAASRTRWRHAVNGDELPGAAAPSPCARSTRRPAAASTPIPAAAEIDEDAVAEAVRRDRSGDRRADPPRSTRRAGTATAPPRSPGFLQHGRSRAVARRGRPAPARRRGVGGARVRRERDRDRAAHLDAGRRRPQRAAQPADRRDPRAGRPLRGRVAGCRTHAIVHPNLGAAELDAMVDDYAALRPSGWKCYPLYGPPTSGVAHGWLVPRRRRDRVPVPRARPRVGRAGSWRCTRASGGPDPVGVGGGGVAPRRRAGRGGVPRRELPRVPLGLRARPGGRGGRVRSRSRRPASTAWSASLAGAGIAPGANVYAELGSTWYLMLRRPVEAAHVLGKLLLAVGPDRIVWGTDSIWYGSPQPLIDAFRTFEIPERMQEEFGYPRSRPRRRRRSSA